MDLPDLSKLPLQDKTNELIGSTGSTGSQASASSSVAQIQQLLGAKDDTSRFVGLALLKSTLDNSPELQQDETVVTSLWHSISPKFLDRLLRTGSDTKNADGKNMLDIAGAVIYTFAVLLPEEEKSAPRLLGRIPRLVQAVLKGSEETTELIIRTLATLTSQPEGGRVFGMEVGDWTPLIEVAPKYQLVLLVFSLSWSGGAVPEDYRPTLTRKIDNTISALVTSYKGTDAVTLLNFVAEIMHGLDDDLKPRNPKWLSPLVDFIRKLSTNRPTQASRTAYTMCATQLIINYRESAPQILFSNESTMSNPFSYHFITLIIIDLRASIPSLLEKINTPEYPKISNRLTGCLLILESFIAFLVRSMDDETSSDVISALQLSPDLILKLQKSISETLTLIIEFLRDRWDAAVAGAHGLHPEARAGESHATSGTLKTLTWDSKYDSADTDPVIMVSLRVLGAWLQDDDGETLKNETTGLMDMLLDLYQSPLTASESHVRSCVLDVLYPVTRTEDGVAAFLEYDGWAVLIRDLRDIVKRKLTSSQPDHAELELGEELADLLADIADGERGTPGMKKEMAVLKNMLAGERQA